MTATDWMEKHISGFAELSAEERVAIQEFSLLWAFFEAQVFNGWASAIAISTAIEGHAAKARLDVRPFESSLEYFSNRYVTKGAINHRFAALNFRGNDQRERVEAVLREEANDSAEIVIALLIIVYRLRCNLFHGEKWAYGIQGQRDNFLQATQVLMGALDMLSGRVGTAPA